jgi:Zn-dependent protease with chaperone function
MQGQVDGEHDASLTRAQARYYLLRFGGPLALVPSLLQPAAVLAIGITSSVVVGNPLPLLLPLTWIALPLWWSHDPSPMLDHSNEPELVGLVHDVAAAVGTNPPGRIRLDAAPNASFGRHRLTRGGELRLGIPLVVGLDASALAAVVAHELAHGVQLGRSVIGKPDLELRLVAVRRRVAARMAAQRHRRPVRTHSLVARFLRQTQPLAFAAEHEADALAARTAGEDATGRALRAAARIDAALSLFAGFQVAPLLAGGMRPASLLTSFQRWLEQADARVLDRVTSAADEDTYDDLLDDHPAPTERELAAAAARHPSTAGRSAFAPVRLRDHAAADAVLERVMLSPRQRRLPVAPPSADHDQFVRAWRRGAARVRLHLLRAGRRRGPVPSLEQAVDQLAQRQAHVGDAEQLAALRVAVAVSFALELGDRGWIGPLPGSATMVSPAETFDDALALAVQAVDEGAGTGPLIDALRAGRPRLTSAS